MVNERKEWDELVRVLSNLRTPIAVSVCVDECDSAYYSRYLFMTDREVIRVMPCEIPKYIPVSVITTLTLKDPC